MIKFKNGDLKEDTLTKSFSKVFNEVKDSHETVSLERERLFYSTISLLFREAEQALKTSSETKMIKQKTLIKFMDKHFNEIWRGYLNDTILNRWIKTLYKNIEKNDALRHNKMSFKQLRTFLPLGGHVLVSYKEEMLKKEKQNKRNNLYLVYSGNKGESKKPVNGK